MGWSMPDQREMFGRDEMIEAFDIKRISLGGPVFDFAKLNWLNGQYIRKLSPHEFLDRVRDWAFRDDQLEAAGSARAGAHRAPHRSRAAGRAI